MTEIESCPLISISNDADRATGGPLEDTTLPYCRLERLTEFTKNISQICNIFSDARGGGGVRGDAVG
jgi:hypothetical protein